MNRCLVGISGGIDSLFAAIELKRKGFEVVCVKMHLHSNSPLPEDVSAILKAQSIEFYYADYRKEFEQYVINYFVNEYKSGYTPNPCVICNQFVKMKMLYKEAQSKGFDKIATGHYANIENGYLIRHKSSKDQSYFLSCVEREILNNTLFPLNKFNKETIKESIGINKQESSDLCFVKNNYRSLLGQFIQPKKGVIMQNNQIVGSHDGFFNYTIGQRKGIKVENTPHYVTKIDSTNNIVFVGKEEDLKCDGFYIEQLKFFEDKYFFKNRHLECQVRYNTKPKECTIDIEKKYVKLIEEERAVTPGQIAVLYYKNRVVACGRITYGIY